MSSPRYLLGATSDEYASEKCESQGRRYFVIGFHEHLYRLAMSAQCRAKLPINARFGRVKISALWKSAL